MIRIGPAGWAYKDWQGIVYPAKRPTGFNELSYIADLFDFVEINSSFYGPPRATSAKKWIDSVSSNKDFRFTAKLFQSFTHARKPAPLDEKDFKDGIAPLLEANRLGALLAQFPWSFKNEADTRDHIAWLHKIFEEYPLVVEIRHASWATPEILEFFSELGIGICNIDQPLFHNSVKPSADVTSGVGYVRLHGRNYQNWFSPKADVRERYDHLYSLEDLEPWVARAKQISEEASDTYVVTNNHNIGKAVANGLQLAALFAKPPRGPIPPQLLQHYPELAELTADETC